MGFFRLNHMRINYRLLGEGPLLIVLHGNTASSWAHQADLEEFSDRFMVAAPDLPGCGTSERIYDWQPDWWEHAGDVAAALADSLKEPRFIVMGTSGGAVAALYCAMNHPERVDAVVADSVVPFLPPDRLRAEVEKRRQVTPDQKRFWRFCHGDDWDAVVEEDNQLLLRFADAGGAWFENRLGEIACPVLITASLQDDSLVDVQAQVESMAARIPTCRVFLSPTGGHPLMWSERAAWRAQVDAFLATIAQGL